MSEFKSWEEMTELEKAGCTYSDMYKDAYGVRSRNDTSSWTIEKYEEEIKFLDQMIFYTIEQEAIQRKKDIEYFESRIAEAITLGAKDRDDAINMLMKASELEGDFNVLEFMYGLPYNYLKKGS